MSRAIQIQLGLAVALLASGCEVDPYCIDGCDEGGVSRDGGMDAAVDSGSADAGTDASADAGTDACVDVELCNGIDDDCDGEVDEGFDLDTDVDNCGGCGDVCAPFHAFGACVDGTCGVETCDVEWLDINMDPSDGCEYRCVSTELDDLLCDLRDNDCDGMVDEDIDFPNDPENCGSCGRLCRFAHASGTCVMGMCEPGPCDLNFYDIDLSPTNGCEYSCVLSSPPDEVCDLADNDCDGMVDEGNPGGGGACGGGVGECVAGIETCTRGAIVCMGAVGPTTELCNGLDDDCDGSVDEGDPEGGRLCGTGTGTCTRGREVCTGGSLVCTGGTGPGAELCDGLDNNCDSVIDDGNPGGGGSCGSGVGACVAGTENCRGGVLVCEGSVGPISETCNGVDDNCDGSVDEGNPGGGSGCGTDVGTCVPGVRTCMAGALNCVGSVGPGTETCNSLDDDCDGSVDEGNPGGGAACGSATGTCTAGVETCVGGAISCVGGTGPSTETCNGVDDDCDGMVDEGNPGGGGGCGTDVGQCSFGALSCTGGSVICVGGTGPVAETCNSLDDDCDGAVDESNPGGGGACGSMTGVCSVGVEQCIGGAISCVGGTGPTTETCNGVDDDCDGMTDEGNPGGGGTCGTNVGQCTFGTRTCSGGMLLCVGGTAAVAETCNSLDDDCDGLTDEGNPGGGAACGSSTGACTAGTQTCVGGAISCLGGRGPTPEICNNVDDNCNGMVDEGNPGGGSTCGTDVGLCTFGTRTCSGGGILCVGGTAPVTEVCNGLDDDCDSSIDEGNPGGGASCGSSVGECVAGSEACLGGTMQCSGGTGPTFEICDTRDNDCDGMVDEGFDLTSDPLNCGSCGTSCAALPHAISGCVSSGCRLLSCDAGWVDLDGLPGTGCEYMCSFSGAEICNGRDDDCDGLTDEGLTPPSTFCNANGVCMGTTPTCGGAGGWVCNYPPTYQASETRCDGLDNDCDGSVDGPFPLVGTSCNNGELGACRINGSYVCNAAMDGVRCTAGPSGGGSAETCNNEDDDCDGATDEYAPNAWVPYTAGALGTRYIYAYEASRPDATATTQGSASHRSCSVANRLPWTDVTYPQAQAACVAVGGRLCTETEWQEACESTSNTCVWSHAATCTTYQPLICNGDDYDTDAGTPGDQDGTIPTGSLASCYSNWGGAGRVYDMSGNVEEWTQARQTGINPLRGGSNNDVQGGMRCNFNFVVAGNAISLPSVGFRCCRDTPVNCVNGVRDGTETDIDCGGTCTPCANGRACTIAGNCQSGVCTGGICAVPTCGDGVQNGGESDVDCGGPTACPRCGDLRACTLTSDCAVGQCIGGRCRNTTCSEFGTGPFGYVGCEGTPAVPPCTDIRGTGTALVVGDDGSANVPIGFNFDFYGTNRTTVRVNANGALTFGGTSMSQSNQCMPYGTQPAFIAPFWDDLDPGNPGGQVLYQTLGTAPNRRFVALWDAEHWSSTPSRSDIRVVLYEGSSDIRFCYVDTDFGNAAYDTGETATSGIQGSTTSYLMYSCNVATLTNGLTLDYFHP